MQKMMRPFPKRPGMKPTTEARRLSGLSGIGRLRRYASGSFNVQETGPAVVDAGEAILPKSLAQDTRRQRGVPDLGPVARPNPNDQKTSGGGNSLLPKFDSGGYWGGVSALTGSGTQTPGSGGAANPVANPPTSEPTSSSGGAGAGSTFSPTDLMAQAQQRATGALPPGMYSEAAQAAPGSGLPTPSFIRQNVATPSGPMALTQGLRNPYGLSADQIYQQLYRKSMTGQLEQQTGGKVNGSAWNSYLAANPMPAYQAQYDDGTYNVPSDQTALLHEGEAVLPESLSEAVRSEPGVPSTGPVSRSDTGTYPIAPTPLVPFDSSPTAPPPTTREGSTAPTSLTSPTSPTYPIAPTPLVPFGPATGSRGTTTPQGPISAMPGEGASPVLPPSLGGAGQPTSPAPPANPYANPAYQGMGPKNVLSDFLARNSAALPAPNQMVARNWPNLDPNTQALIKAGYEAQGYDPTYIDWLIPHLLPGRAGVPLGFYGRIAG